MNSSIGESWRLYFFRGQWRSWAGALTGDFAMRLPSSRRVGRGARPKRIVSVLARARFATTRQTLPLQCKYDHRCGNARDWKVPVIGSARTSSKFTSCGLHTVGVNVMHWSFLTNIVFK